MNIKDSIFHSLQILSSAFLSHLKQPCWAIMQMNEILLHSSPPAQSWVGKQGLGMGQGAHLG